MLVVEMAAGLMAGLMFGFAMGLLRPLIVLLVVAAAVAALLVLVFGGVTGLVDLLGHIAAGAGRHAPFFAALAVGNVVSRALAYR